jgi:hypothetical protein
MARGSGRACVRRPDQTFTRRGQQPYSPPSPSRPAERFSYARGQLTRASTGILHPLRRLVGKVPTKLALDEPKGQVDAAGDAAAGYQVAVIDGPVPDEGGAGGNQVLPGRVVLGDRRGAARL